MKITLLTDNNTLIDKYYIGEPGFCAYIEVDNTRLLFDLGYSNAFLQNALKMRIDLSDLKYIVISHGHSDHTWGFESIIRYYSELEMEQFSHSRPMLLANPGAFTSITADGYSEIGPMLSEDKLAKYFTLRLKKEPQEIAANLFYLGEIPRKNDFEGRLSFGRKDGENENDFVNEDTALAYKAKDGLVIITGCSHSGICNIIEYAKQITNENRILDIIGGFHLQNPSREQMNETLKYLKNQNIDKMHPCHCTDLRSKIEISSTVKIEDAGVGLKLGYD